MSTSSSRACTSYLVPPSPINRHYSLHDLSFRGVDTGNAYYSLLPIFANVTTLTVQQNWNSVIVPQTLPVRLPDVFPYTLEERHTHIDTLKIINCMPKVARFWVKALQVFVPHRDGLKHLLFDGSMLLFQDQWQDADAAVRDICPYIQHIGLDLGRSRPIHILPPNKEGFRAMQKFVASTRNHEKKTALPHLREIRLTAIFKRQTDRKGRPEKRRDYLSRLKACNWPAIDQFVRAIGWLSGKQLGGGLIYAKVYTALEEESGTLWPKEDIEEIVSGVLGQDIVPFMRMPLDYSRSTLRHERSPGMAVLSRRRAA
ncbi:hypothetical protein NM688_g1681 [Phlebia brevispora]|uniref:Uncharacterized protein n=1 Tax=Phlebia brevispora TaxID=194682 RepID=A0ACC1TB47_9APHY|nr:hypothetical protein NM688_g1681 [Phlebia brevispora]